MSTFINLPTDVTKVDSAASSVSTNPLQNKVVVETIDVVFDGTNYNLSDGQTMVNAQFALVQQKKPIIVNTKTYYYSSSDSTYYYYNNIYKTISGVGTSMLQVHKANQVVTFTEVEVGQIQQQVEFSTFSQFPSPGSEDVLYVDKSTGVMYLWNTSVQAYEPTVLPSNELSIQSIL